MCVGSPLPLGELEGANKLKIMKIYHNPRCSKSRETLQLIQDKGVDVEIIEYMKDIPSKTELLDVLKKLKLNAEDIVRKTETDLSLIHI